MRLVAAVLVPLTLAGAAGAGTPVLRATVLPGTSVSLVDASGTAVSQLEPGPYTIAVDDRAPQDNFHLSGPGVNLDSGLKFEGSLTWNVTLADGPYSYVSDPRAEAMRGAFLVGTVPPPRLRATVTDSSIALEGGPVDTGTYAIEVDDRSRSESFRLVGPGVELHTQRHTAYNTTWLVTLAAGTYHFFSDRRPDRLHGTLVVGGGAGPAGPRSTLRAFTGSDFAIALVGEDGAPVRRLERGSYTIVVDDRSPDHNFHLTGPGVSRTTTLEQVGTQTWTVNVTGGGYAFFCDPHTLTMTGDFAAPLAPATRLTARLTAAGATLRDAAGRGVTRLRAGRFAIRVADRSKTAGFVLRGPGVSRQTGVRFVGAARWRVDLVKGTYRYGAAGRLRVLRVV